jgi:16S rRNA (cytidine1402-2'-O)-methyltransferase
MVSTPIGNMGDMTQRAIDTLNCVDVIACEDKRHSGRLFKHYGIETRLISYHDNNKETSAPGIVKLVLEGKDVALVTDSGTPGISDPAYTLLNLALEKKIDVISVPGPCAAIAALTVSGLPMDRFIFEGFLPVRSGKRRSRLLDMKTENRTLVFYESPHRLLKVLAVMRETLGDRRAVAARELTKLHEEIIRGSLDSLIEHFSNETPRGEFVLVIGGFAEH